MVEYKFVVGDKVRRVTHSVNTMPVGFEGTITKIDNFGKTIYFEGNKMGWASEYFDLIQQGVINNYSIY